MAKPRPVRDPYLRILSYRRHQLKKALSRNGMTHSEYERMLAEQGGLCAICYGPPLGKTRLSIDHDHKSNRVRGLLCDSCNRAIGYFKDDADRAIRAANYLKKHALPLEGVG